MVSAPLHERETVPSDSRSDELASLESEYQEAERAFEAAKKAVRQYYDAHNPELMRFNGVLQRAEARRNELLKRRADLRFVLGLSR